MGWGSNIFCDLRIPRHLWKVEGKYPGLNIGRQTWDKLVPMAHVKTESKPNKKLQTKPPTMSEFRDYFCEFYYEVGVKAMAGYKVKNNGKNCNYFRTHLIFAM